MKLTVTHHGYHGRTSCSIIVDGQPGDRVELSDSQLDRLSRTACGISGCECGESLLDACSGPQRGSILIPDNGAEIVLEGNYAG